MEQLLQDFPADLRFVYRHYPLIGTPEQPFHDKAALSTQAAEAAGKQGKFWEMHDVIFANQDTWVALTPADYQTWLIDQAGQLDLDVSRFTADLTSQELVDFAQEAWDYGQRINMTGTPFLMVNGNIWPSSVPMDYTSLATVIRLTLLEERQFSECPPMTLNLSKQYVATLHTEKGDIVIELYDDQAPLAVNSFIFLAEQGWFDGVTFHRVIPGFVAQSGDPSGTGYGQPGYAFRNETASGLTFDGPGVVGMANPGADSNGSQFFITFAAAPTLDGNYTVFGHVISGMDVVESLTPRNPAENMNLPPGDAILSVTIEEK